MRIFVAAVLLVLLTSPLCGDVNVASSNSGCVIVADSVYSGDMPEKAIDGKWIGPGDFVGANRWHAALGKPHPHWLWMRFGRPARISRVVIHRADAADYPVDLVAEYSADGGFTFRQLFSITDNRMGADEFTTEKSFDPVVTDNLRLRILRSSHAEHTDYCQVSEVEVFGEYVEQAPVVGPSVKARQWDRLLEPTRRGLPKIDSEKREIEFRSKWLRVVLDQFQPRVKAICWDSLGAGKVEENLLKEGKDGGITLTPMRVFVDPFGGGRTDTEVDGNVIRYSTVATDGLQTRWEIRVTEKSIHMAAATFTPSPVVARTDAGIRFAFDVSKTPVAPLANPRPGVTAPLPCLLHATDYGTILLKSTSSDARLSGESLRGLRQWNAIVSAGGTAPREDGLLVLKPGVTRLEIAANVERITPIPSLTRSDARLAGMPRHWLNSFQYRPDIGIFANNIVSDNVVFCMHMYADAAVYTPTLPGGIKPMTMVRESLDRYFNGANGYGVGWEDIEMDVYPSLLIAAWDVVRSTGDMTLLKKWLPHLERISSAMKKQDRNGNGIMESTRTGVMGTARCPSSNWWDQINFGHEDAYGSALAYRALNCLADLEMLADSKAKAAEAKQMAIRIKEAYLPTFYNPDTGVLAGWRDSEGKLHDYCFTFVNGIAIVNGLVPEDLANKIIDRIEAKMKEVGYDRFDLGLPGPLAVIPKADYGPGALGSPKLDDGTDSYQVFEHGGATACFAHYYIQALYKLGRKAEADRILWAMMKTYNRGGFQNGVGNGGEWTRWDGTPSGYEGMLCDAYTTETALFSGYYGIAFTPDGFKLEPWSPLKGKRTELGLTYMGKPVVVR